MREIRRPVLRIDVPAHGMGRRKLPKPVEHLRLADIPGMNDEISAAERSQSRRADQPVRIGSRAAVCLYTHRLVRDIFSGSRDSAHPSPRRSANHEPGAADFAARPARRSQRRTDRRNGSLGGSMSRTSLAPSRRRANTILRV